MNFVYVGIKVYNEIPIKIKKKNFLNESKRMAN